MTRSEALQMAAAAELDLVEVRRLPNHRCAA